jgi:GNAT superfamily N-acetyltransferase
MECDLGPEVPEVPRLPAGFAWTPWHAGHLDRHATAKLDSFRGEPDSRVFPCLGDYHGCLRLMADIARHDGFLPGATWLITFAGHDDEGPCDCGTIQGIEQNLRWGAIQNVGIVPEFRGLGLGRALVLKSLAGFHAARMRRVYLEVTAENAAAVGLYRSLGFRVTRTMFKEIAAEPATCAT